MTDIRQLIQKTIEIEGLLKILLERDDPHAREILSDRYDEFCGLMDVFVDHTGYADPHLARVKDDEAEETQVKPEIEAAEQAIARGEEISEAPYVPGTDSVNVTESKTPPVAPYTVPVESVESAAPDSASAGEAFAPQIPHQRNMALLRAFTLNDKFRFIREVFGGDERDFNDTLSLIADMDTYAEAEEYITGDMMLDKENPGVAEFLEFIAPYMKH